MVGLRPLAAFVLLPTMLTACTPIDRDPSRIAVADDLVCGLRAARQLSVRSQVPDPDHPPACALPDAQTIARMCAVHDRTNVSGYDPERDEEGNLVNQPPLPTYVISNAACAFTDGNRNAATCSFSITLPGETVMRPPVTTRFQHIYWREDGPASHMEGTMWIAREDCTPEIK